MPLAMRGHIEILYLLNQLIVSLPLRMPRRSQGLINRKVDGYTGPNSLHSVKTALNYTGKQGKKREKKGYLGVKITINNRIIPTMLLQVLYKAPRYLLLWQWFVEYDQYLCNRSLLSAKFETESSWEKSVAILVDTRNQARILLTEKLISKMVLIH